MREELLEQHQARLSPGRPGEISLLSAAQGDNLKLIEKRPPLFVYDQSTRKRHEQSEVNFFLPIKNA